MKISAVRAIPIKVPRLQAFTATGTTLTHSDFGIVAIETDDGVSGIGEISSALSWKRLGPSHCLDVDLYLAPAILGQDPLEIPSLVMRMDRALEGGQLAKAGVEMALWDIAGKSAGLPVYRLLGGKARSAVSLNWTMGWGEPDATADEAEKYIGLGLHSVRLKIGRPGDADVRALQAVRDRLGDGVDIKLDANAAWASAKEAIQAIRPLEAYRPQLIEQPLRADDLAGHAFVRQHIDTPILLDESIWSVREAMSAVRADAADAFNVYVSESGGLLNASKIFAVAEAAGLPCLIGTMGELAIGTAAGAHLGVAMTNLGYASDLVGTFRYAETVVHEEIEVRDGYLYPPERPGLGVTPNWEIIDKYRV